MDKTILVEDMLIRGEIFIDDVKKYKGFREINFHSALWLYDKNDEEWRLTIAVSNLNEIGKRAAYEALDDIMPLNGFSSFNLSDISVIKSTDPLIQALQTKEALVGHGTRIRRNIINDVYIEDAYIYEIGHPER